MDASQSTDPFVVGEMVVHHVAGIGKIVAIKKMKLFGFEDVFIAVRMNTKTAVYVPLSKANLQLRKLDQPIAQAELLAIIKSRPEKANAIWGKKKRVWIQKVNSGNPVLIAEVVRDVAPRHYGAISPTQREIFHAACQRLINEFAVTNNKDVAEVVKNFNHELIKFGIILEYVEKLITIAGESAPS